MSNSNDQGTMTVNGPSSEPGSESPRGNSGGSGNSGSNGGKANNYTGVSKTVGDALARSWSLNPTDFTGYYVRKDGDVIGIVSPSAPVKPTVDGYVVGVNLGPMPPNIVDGNNKDEGAGGTVNNKQIVGEIINFRGDTSDARIAALNKIVADNEKLANSGQAGQRIVRAKQATRLAQAELALIHNIRKKKAAEARAKAEAEAEAQRNQAEWDATHQVEAAQRDLDAAQANLNNARNAVNAAQNGVNAANANVAQKVNEYNAAQAQYARRMEDVKRFSVFANEPTLPGYRNFMQAGQYAAQDKQVMDARKGELDAAYNQLNAANSNLNNANLAMAAALNNQVQADNKLAEARSKRDATEKENAAIRAAEEKARKEQEERNRQREKEAIEKAINEKEVLTKTSELITEMGDKVGEHLGNKYKAIAKEIADDIKNFQGKTIRSYDDAMDSLNKITSNPGMKINKADKDAIVNAWKNVDANDMANKLGNLGKAFKVADLVIKIEKVREKCIEGYETGDWGPLVLEVESWVLSGLTASVALGIFSATIGVALLAAGVPAVAVGIMGIITAALMGSLIDDKFVGELNNQIIRTAN